MFRAQVFFTLHDDPHMLSDDDEHEGQQMSEAPPELDAVYERVLAAHRRGHLRHERKDHSHGHSARGKGQMKEKGNASPFGKGNVSPLAPSSPAAEQDFRERQSHPGSPGSKGSASPRKSSTRSRAPMDPVDTLKLMKAHTQVERNLFGKDNFFHVRKEFGLKQQGEVVSDTDGSMSYVMTCRELNVAPIPAFIGQLNDEFIFMRHCAVGPRGGRAIGQSLSLNSRPVDVDLGFCEIGSDGVRALAVGLNRTAFYRSLDLTANRMGNVGAEALASCLVERFRLSHLARLMLGSNQLADKGAVTVARVLGACLNLTFLDLSCNKIGYDGAVALGRELEQQTNEDAQKDEETSGAAAKHKHNVPAKPKAVGGLLHLDMSGNLLSNNGTRALCTGLFKNKCLQTLLLAHNNISNEGAHAIAELMIFNDAMTHLDISHNRISGIG